MGGGTAGLVPGGGGRDCMPLTGRAPTGFGPIFSFSSSGKSPFTLWIWWICSSKVILARAARVAASTLDVCPSHVTCVFMSVNTKGLSFIIKLPQHHNVITILLIVTSQISCVNQITLVNKSSNQNYNTEKEVQYTARPIHQTAP